jgi:KAP family P-loop domain
VKTYAITYSDDISDFQLRSIASKLKFLNCSIIPPTSNDDRKQNLIPIQKALRNSDGLLIICSERTGKDVWLSETLRIADQEDKIKDIVLYAVSRDEFEYPQFKTAKKLPIFFDLHHLIEHIKGTKGETAIELGKSVELRQNSEHHEACLNVTHYAEAISDVISDDNSLKPSEINFAIFGKWGQGKTYLAGLIQKGLDSTHREVRFSAWKHPRQPEIWIHLYKSFSDSFKGEGALVKIRNMLRLSLLRTKPAWLLGALFGLLILSIPFSEKINYLSSIIEYIGLFSLIFFVQFFFKIYILSASVSSKSTSIYSNSESLGLQSILARELHDLISAWKPDESTFDKWKNIWVGSIYYLILLAIVFFITIRMYSSVPFEGTSKDIFFTWISLDSSIHVTYLIEISMSLLLVLLPFFIFHNSPYDKKLLLIVDDLDRLNPDQLINTVESLNLLLNDKAIQERLVILMLVDQNILAAAISQKYVLPTIIKPKNANNVHDRLIQEVIEKLFIGHIHVPTISSTEDLSSILETFISTSSTSEPALPEPPSPATDAIPKPDTGTTPKPETEAIPNSAQAIELNINYTDEEKELLKTALLKKYKSLEAPSFPSPRAIKKTLFKYQLARTILRKFDPNFSSPNLPELVINLEKTNDKNLNQILESLETNISN